MSTELQIVIVGAGGVAESFIASLVTKGCTPHAIVSPTVGHAEALSARYCPTSQVFHSLEEIPTDADIYLLAVPDRVVQEVAQTMPTTQGVWMHTAASVSLETLTQYHYSSAVFYPLNTFSKGRPLPMECVPLFYEGASSEAMEQVMRLAHLLGMQGREAPLSMRRALHLSAVFACNFVNHQWAVAAQMLERANLPVEVLYPLMQETLHKAIALGAQEGQTGPARRGDVETMQAHQMLLEEYPEEWRELYAITSLSIQKLYQ